MCPSSREAAESAAHDLKKAEAEAKAEMANDSPGKLSWTADGLTAMCKAADENIALLTSLLATARKHTE